MVPGVGVEPTQGVRPRIQSAVSYQLDDPGSIGGKRGTRNPDHEGPHRLAGESVPCTVHFPCELSGLLRTVLLFGVFAHGRDP